MALSDGDPVGASSPGLVYEGLLGYLAASGAMNDVGDVVGAAGINSTNDPPEDTVAMLLRDHRSGMWYPLFMSGDVIAGRVVAIESLGDGAALISGRTSGSDGDRQSFNDQRRVACKITFSDGTQGAFRVEPIHLGDGNGDDIVDLLDYSGFSACVSGPGQSVDASGCLPFDIDWDNDVDLVDFGLFQMLFGGDQ